MPTAGWERPPVVVHEEVAGRAPSVYKASLGEVGVPVPRQQISGSNAEAMKNIRLHPLSALVGAAILAVPCLLMSFQAQREDTALAKALQAIATAQERQAAALEKALERELPVPQITQFTGNVPSDLNVKLSTGWPAPSISLGGEIKVVNR